VRITCDTPGVLNLYRRHLTNCRRLSRRFNCGLAVPKGVDVSERSRCNIVGLFMQRGRAKGMTV
jgi:hypothetical protein